ncbi:MAG: nucleotidyltransferase [Candidatus Hydrogenedentes bacterium]|nr:nucleotidyltransferase [Candidatus Hydrogenedentota bacterium]
MTVAHRFSAFLGKLLLTQPQKTDGTTKHRGIRTCLNAHYYGTKLSSANSLLIGSWGKSTQIRPPRDIDILFILPNSVYERYQLRPGNKQSQILQEVKTVVAYTYPNTSLRGDGQVVLVGFGSYAVEVLPAFLLTNNQFWICDTHGGGTYKKADPYAEIAHVKISNDNTNENTRHLIRMMKRWQDYCNVPIKSFLIELTGIEFLESWEYRDKSTVYYDWMIRDYLNFLKGKANGYLWVPGTYEMLFLGNSWLSRADTAYARACKACKFESDDMPYSAGSEWQKIFGPDIPTG